MSAPDVRLLIELRKHAFELRTLACCLPTTGWETQEIAQLANSLVVITDRLAARKVAERVIPIGEMATASAVNPLTTSR